MLVLNNFTNDSRVHKEAMTLTSAGHNVSVIALWQHGLHEREDQYGYRIIRLRLLSRSWNNRILSPPLKYIEFAYRVRQVTKHESVHVIHANDANTLPAAWFSAILKHSRLVYDAHEFETGRDFGGGHIAKIYRKLWSWPERIFIHKAHRVLTVSPSIAIELSRMYKIPLPVVIMNCPEKSQLTPSNRLHDELRIEADKKILLYQGQVTIGRGIEAFLNAVQLIENAIAVVIGDGSALQTLRENVSLGKWQHVIFIGKVPLSELPSYTASANIGMVLTQDTSLNHRYSLPNKLFEYIHAGIPIVGSNLPEISRIITETNTGEVCDPNDVKSIASAIKNLIIDPSRYEKLCENAIEASKLYNWQNEGRKLIDVYASL